MFELEASEDGGGVDTGGLACQEDTKGVGVGRAGVSGKESGNTSWDLTVSLAVPSSFPKAASPSPPMSTS